MACAVPRFDDAYIDNGNVLLDDLFGARAHESPASANTLEFAHARANELRAEGRRVYVCLLGFDCVALPSLRPAIGFEPYPVVPFSSPAPRRI